MVVYIREAHALDSAWPMATMDGTVLEEPRDFAERRDHATHCCSALTLAPMTVVVDDMEDSANRAYDAWPDRLILIDREGCVAWRGEPGPFGFDPDEVAAALARELARERGETGETGETGAKPSAGSKPPD